MMYRHTITVYDSTFSLVKTISDSVDLSAYGIEGHPGLSQGAPVEAAVTPDQKYVYVSNYSMSGAGFGPGGNDTCTPSYPTSPSYVYRIRLDTLTIDRVIPVNKVPKFLAVSPNGKYLLVSNWCSYSLSVIDAVTLTPLYEVDLGPYPRGIAISPDSTTAYIALMGTSDVAVVAIASGSLTWIRNVGSGVRHINISPDGKFLYVTCDRAGYVAKVDTATGSVISRLPTGASPRSAALSTDGRFLYVVNYESGTVSVVDAGAMKVTQTIPVDHHPIGITYDPLTAQVWVSCYSGTIRVFAPAA